MAMSRKHYQEVAEIIRTAEDENDIVRGLIRMFKADNPAFSADRFLVACGYDATEGY